MKKLATGLLLVVLLCTLSACSAFHDTQTRTVAEANPQDTTILVFLNDDVAFDPALFSQLVTTIRSTEYPEDGPRITAASFDSVITDQDGQYYSLNITLADLPDQTVTITKKPFTITRTQTLYNPIQLLPVMPEFTYYVALTVDERFHSTNATLSQPQDDGSYAYFWTGTAAMTVNDLFPNRPLWYLLTVAAAAVIGFVVYLISRRKYSKI